MRVGVFQLSSLPKVPLQDNEVNDWLDSSQALISVLYFTVFFKVWFASRFK
jgi:hypothetical protein